MGDHELHYIHPVLLVRINLPEALEMHNRIVAAISQLLDLVDSLRGFGAASDRP